MEILFIKKNENGKVEVVTISIKGGGEVNLSYEKGTIKTDSGNDVTVDKLVSANLTVDSKATDIMNAAAKYGLAPAANCNGLTFGDGKYMINGEGARQILNDEYTSVGSDTQLKNTKIGSHDVVTIGEVDVYHSATNQKDGKGYTEKNEFRPVLKNRSLDQVTDYNRTGNVAGVEAGQARRTYYKKNKQ